MDIDRLKGRAQELLKEHGDKIEKGVDKAEKFAKSKTSKHDDKIDKVAGRIRKLVPDDQAQPGPAPEARPDGPTPSVD